VTYAIPFFDGHNDFLPRLKNAPEQREELWLGSTGTGHLDLGRMKQGGFAGGLFAIWVPSVSKTPMPDYKELMENAPFEVPLPELMKLCEAQPAAPAMAGHFHWMARVAPDNFVICRTPSAVRASMKGGKIAGVMHMEGAEAIGADLDALYLFYDMGLRSLGPV
jgi:membrane dipeptidase